MDQNRRPPPPPAVPLDRHGRAGAGDGPIREERLSTGVLSRAGRPSPSRDGRGDHHHPPAGTGRELQSPYRAGDGPQPRLYSPLAEKTRLARPDQRRLGRYLPGVQSGRAGENQRAASQGGAAVAGLPADRGPSKVCPPVGMAGGSPLAGGADPQCLVGARADDPPPNRPRDRHEVEGLAEEPHQQGSGRQLPRLPQDPRDGGHLAAGERGPRQGKRTQHQHLRFAGLAEPGAAGGKHGG